MIFQRLLEKRSLKKILLLHGNSVSLFEGYSHSVLSNKNDLVQTLKDHDKSILLLAAPYAFAHVQETVHLKQNELLRADRQILEFSRFPTQSRIIESTAINNETAITALTHLSENAVELLQQIKRDKLKISWKPAVSHLIQQYIKQSTESSQENMELIMNQEMLYLGWKESKICCRHLYFWTQAGSHEDKASLAKNLLHSDYSASKPISIDLHKDDDKAADCNFLCDRLLFPQQKPKQVKSVKKIVKSRNRIKLKKGYFKFAAVAITCLLVFWSIGLNVQLQELKAERNRLSKTVRVLKHSTAKLEQMAAKERSLVKAESLVATLKENSIDPTGWIEQLEHLLPKTSWIRSIKVEQKTIHIQILDTKNSNISKQLTNLSDTFGSIELVNNSNLIIDDISLRTRTFTIRF